MSANIRPLEYTQEVLNKRIEYINLKNIQGIKNISFQLPKSGIIRLNASSETGKSSAFRPFEALVTDKYNSKREIESLVTKGETFGEILVKLYNGTYIGLHLDCVKTTNCFYIIQRPNQKAERLHYPQGLPTVLDELGWYTTGIKKQDFSINVRLKGELPIIDTSKRLNTELFNVALNDNVLENTYSSIKQSVVESNHLTDQWNNQLQSIKYALSQLPTEDEVQLQRELDMLVNLQNKDEASEKLIEQITSLFVISRNKPIQHIAPKHIPQLIQQLNHLDKLSQSLNTLCTLQRPEHFSVDKDVTTNISTLTLINNMLNSLDIIQTSSRPQMFHNDKSIQDKINTLHHIDKLIYILNQIKSIEKVEKPCKPPRNIHVELSQLNTINKALSNLSQITQTLQTKPETQHKVLRYDKLLLHLNYLMSIQSVGEETKKKLEEIKVEKSKYQCPTCGQYVSSEHQHD